MRSEILIQSLVMKNTPDGPTIYEHAIPAFVGAELERLYENVYCTLGRFKVYQEDIGASTYVARRDGRITAVILFRQVGSCLHVINQQVHIPADELQVFLSEIFARYTSVHSVRFYAMENDVCAPGYSTATFPSVEENIISLPSTSDAFMESLSVSSRKNLRSAGRRILRHFPSFQYTIHAGNEVDDKTMHQIFSLCDQRMDVKKKERYINSDAARNIIRLVRLYGFVGVATIEGRVCGGNIWYRVGSRNFMHILAHDPRFDSYKLGNYQSYLSLSDCIAHGGRECWMMGGGREHKSRFLAKTKHLNTTIVFRSRLRRLLAVQTTTKAAISRLRHAAKEALFRARGEMAAEENPDKVETFAARLARSFVAVRGQTK